MSKGFDFSFGEQKRKKYQEESTKVSKVSVSLLAFSPVFLQVVLLQLGCSSSYSVYMEARNGSGNFIGSSILSTGKIFPFSK